MIHQVADWEMVNRKNRQVCAGDHQRPNNHGRPDQVGLNVRIMKAFKIIILRQVININGHHLPVS